ncbi:MAG TPA: hypothetical protein VE954_37990 [Oligoflexus sp.]|uniref:hypothetical protein n=1 Tax=Oligoflexus sp. TaxID=1971216 RepID=UPI002D279245|nr:hypothetical protein [Oligoflexus sp.]HYX38933.1 hypothetical protein [Oligoflexus sp.]
MMKSVSRCWIRRAPWAIPLALSMLCLACGKDDDSGSSDPATADVLVAGQPKEETVAPAADDGSGGGNVDPNQDTVTPGQTPTEPEPAAVPASFDRAAYLAGQESAMLAFVDKLKAIRVYDAPPEFLKPTTAQSQVGIHFGSPFTSSPAEEIYRADLGQFPASNSGCNNQLAGSQYHQIAALWEVGSFPGRHPLGLEYRLYVIIQNGVLAIVDVDIHWMTLDRVNHFYSLNVLCSDAVTPVLPATNAANF